MQISKDLNLFITSLTILLISLSYKDESIKFSGLNLINPIFLY